MLSLDDAKNIVNQNVSDQKLEAIVGVPYKNLYVFVIGDRSNSKLSIMDPFRSVDKNSGYFDAFSLLTDTSDPEALVNSLNAELKKQGLI